MLKKSLAALAGLGALAGACIGDVRAEPAAYPHRVVALVTHSSPGGGSDVFLREMSKHLGKYINATFVVENVQGGSGARAISRLATAKPDGSVFYATTPTYIYTSLLSKPSNTFRDLDPLVNFFTDADFFFQAEDGIRDIGVTGVQTCALPISRNGRSPASGRGGKERRTRR